MTMHERKPSDSVGQDPVIAPLAVARIVFDTAVNSMDFGSGFLDHEEVEALRAFAVLLGVDPMVATPDNFRCQYDGGHQWGEGHSLCTKCHRCRQGNP